MLPLYFLSSSIEYSADHATGAVKIAPANGTHERYLLQNVLSYISSELHASVAPLFYPTLSNEVAEHYRHKAATKLQYINDKLVGTKKFVVGKHFTVADAYLYIVLSWSDYLKVDLAPFPQVRAYFEHIHGMDEVQAAHARMATGPSTTV